MSERITHTGLLDDGFRLASAATDLSIPSLKAIRSFHELARLASTTRHGDQHTVQLLTRIRSELASTQGKENQHDVLRRLAFVYGWLLHRAADRQMKPVFRELAEDDPQFPTDCSIYHDAYIFHRVYAIDGENALYSSSSIDAKETSQSKLKDLIRTLIQQSLIELHTLTPDPEDAWGWIGRLDAQRCRFEVDMDRYARAITSPDPQKVSRYIEEPTFYDEDDPVLQLTRAIQRGEQVPIFALRELIEKPAKSHYGIALVSGLRQIVAADDFLQQIINSDELTTILQIGELGRDGRYV